MPNSLLKQRFLLGFTLFSALALVYLIVAYATLPNVKQALANGISPAPTSQILARDGSVIKAYGKFYHKPVKLSQVPNSLIQAIIATEDRRFYEHRGLDPFGILRAVLTNVRAGGTRQGASTITQQLARTVFLSNDRTLHRKVQEAFLAGKLENELSKEQILEMYLNNAYFGEGTYGVEAASRVYFGKPVSQLRKAEAALLAGLPQAPSRYNPFAHPNRAVRRRNEVIDNMLEVGSLSPADARILKQRQLVLNPNGRVLAAADSASFFARRILEETLQKLHLDEDTFWEKGYKVHTTLDPRAQSIAEKYVRDLSARYGRTGSNRQASLISMDDRGRTLAYVGGKNYSTTQFDRVTDAKRPVGSLFKVFVYTAAMEKGISPNDVYVDEPVQYGNWRPENYDRLHHGEMTLARALSRSNNIVAVKLTEKVSPQAVIDVARRMGLHSPMKPDLSIALGAVEASLQEMTGAFNALNNNGTYVTPYGLEKIVSRHGEVLFEHQPKEKNILRQDVRDTMVALMLGVVKYGTGRRAQITHASAGKTGTSDEYRDAWFIGFTPGITTGVWVGNDDNTQMAGITGGTMPSQLWHAYMTDLLAGLPKREFVLAQAKPIHEQDFLYEDTIAAGPIQRPSFFGGLFRWIQRDLAQENRPRNEDTRDSFSDERMAMEERKEERKREKEWRKHQKESDREYIKWREERSREDWKREQEIMKEEAEWERERNREINQEEWDGPSEE